MAKPIDDTLKAGKNTVMNTLEAILPGLDMKLMGTQNDLGLMSFKTGSGEIFHAHIVESNDQETRISIAPGLSNMKDRPQSEVPESTIAKIFQTLGTKLKK